MMPNQLLHLIIKDLPNLLLLTDLLGCKALLILLRNIASVLNEYPETVCLAGHAGHVHRGVPVEVLVVEQSHFQVLLLRAFNQHDVVVDPTRVLLDQSLEF